MGRCLVIDMASHADPIINELQQNGVTTVFRYYASSFQEHLPQKRLMRAEADALLEAGLGVGVVYQFHNNELSSMTRERGRADANFSLNHANNVIAQPEGSAMYFGVDGDWFTTADQAKVARYFEAVNEVFADAGRPYRIGVYGSGTTCRNLKAAGLATLFWLPLSTGWSGTRDFSQRWGMELLSELPRSAGRRTVHRHECREQDLEGHRDVRQEWRGIGYSAAGQRVHVAAVCEDREPEPAIRSRNRTPVPEATAQAPQCARPGGEQRVVACGHRRGWCRGRILFVQSSRPVR